MSKAARDNLEALDWQADSLVRGWAGEVAPTLADKTVSFVFGEVYALQHMPARYRELVITAILAATGALPDGMVEHAELACREGATREELDELFTLVAAYSGFPRALAAARDLQRQRNAAPPAP